MRIDAEIGTVLIKDSIWRNFNTAGGGLLSHNMSDLKVIIFRESEREKYLCLS